MPRTSKWFIKVNDDDFGDKIKELVWHEEGSYHVVDLSKNEWKLMIKAIYKSELHDRIEECHIHSLENKLFESYDFFEYGLISKTVSVSEDFRKVYIEKEEMCRVSKEW